MSFPPLPTWEALHPAAVHFPIALLLVAPVFALAALVLRRERRGLSQAAFFLMLLGTAGAFLAVSTGEAAEERTEGVPGAAEVLEEHEEEGELTRNVFTGLTLLYGGLLLAPRLLKRDPGSGLFLAAHVLFLLLYLGGTSLLANTAYLGGRLVHEIGVRGYP
ncbi:MAG TPA: DUF2231 domain-containing protein [Thermoanaerobaculia bacterium]|nr:DUF2231 domain-containing protein [Thermoanaerobaculia bacterium]